MSAPPDNSRKTTPRSALFYRAAMCVLAPIEWVLNANCRYFLRLSSARLDRQLKPVECLFYHLHRLICWICRSQDRRVQQLHSLFTVAKCDACLVKDETMSAEAKERLGKELAGELAKRKPGRD